MKFKLKLFPWLLSAAIFPLSSIAESTLGSENPVKVWSQHILKNQPEKILAETYHDVQSNIQSAGQNLWGNTTLSLSVENGQLIGRNGVSNIEVGASFPLKRLNQEDVFNELSKGYAQLGKHQQAWLAWKSRGIARNLLDTVSKQLLISQNNQQRLQQAKRLYEMVEAQVKAGAGSRLDLALAKQQLSEAQARAAGSEAALKATQPLLKAWGISLPVSEMKVLLKVHPTPVSFSDLDALIQKHPQVLYLQAQQRLSIAQSEKSVWEAKQGQELYLGIRQKQADGVKDDHLLVAKIAFPLGQSSDFKMAKADAKLEQQQKQVELNLTKRDIRQALIAAQAQLLEAKARLAPIRQQLAAANEALKLSEQVWKQGEISLRDLLIAQQTQLNTALSVALAELAVHQAVRHLNQQAGE